MVVLHRRSFVLIRMFFDLYVLFSISNVVCAKAILLVIFFMRRRWYLSNYLNSPLSLCLSPRVLSLVLLYLHLREFLSCSHLLLSQPFLLLGFNLFNFPYISFLFGVGKHISFANSPSHPVCWKCPNLFGICYPLYFARPFCIFNVGYASSVPTYAISWQNSMILWRLNR